MAELYFNELPRNVCRSSRPNDLRERVTRSRKGDPISHNQELFCRCRTLVLLQPFSIIQEHKEILGYILVFSSLDTAFNDNTDGKQSCLVMIVTIGMTAIF